ncbi:ribosome small subunit-dependent GTPase A [Mycoplasma miroungirhinis]|uniref:Small ribosomal subunit biogenesis GTPase RsgA n=1 Tax=Mycoplasma miroungirhinis TaxID=754516 RepID=A0A6M4JD98_9MOLU|nr:ribosome small subunit-dependent GTPase A [Mycoplasma miroungirhinis]QJR44228.1 ribosome small subunit-dependent GTPase A [Mycoplasma miroungirhinis]
MIKGKIIRSISGFYDVKTAQKEIIRTRGSGKLRLLNIKPTVGDYVDVNKDNMIEKIYERKNQFIRPKIVNVDQAIVVMSLVEPNFSYELMDKFLIIIENKHIKPVIVLTKSDLTNESKIDYFKKQKYEVFEINYQKQTGFNNLKDIFANKTSFFVGQTGVGKTTLINFLAKTNLQTQEISKALNRGKHTTREVSLIEFNGGEIIDTPGFSSIDFDITIDEISTAFSKFAEASKKCKFRNCKHNLENIDNCEIKRLVQNKEIPEMRYKNYLTFLKQITEKEHYE